jgi:hypothetical protein
VTRFGVLAVPEAFQPDALECSGFGNVDSRLRHGMSCHEVACELRYLPRDFPWEHVLRHYARAGLPLDGGERASYEARRREALRA